MNNSSSDECYGVDAVFVYNAYAVLNIVFGLVACLFGTFVLAILFLLDKHLFYNQRILIYLNISVILGGIVSITSINPFLSHGTPTRSTYCTINGFMYNWSILSQLIIIWWITIDVFRLTANTKILKIPGYKLEVILVMVAFLLPPMILWIPALPQIDAYGPDGPLCDIQTLNYTTCEIILVPGYVGLAVYRVLPFLCSLIVLSSLLIIGMFKLRKELGKSLFCNPQQGEVSLIRRSAIHLQIYPLLFFIFSIAPSIHFIVRAANVQDGWIILTTYFFYIVGNNLRSITLSLAFVYNKDTRVSFRSMTTVRTLREFFKINSNPVTPYNNDPSLYVSQGDSRDAKEFKARNKQYALTESLLDEDRDSQSE